MNAQQLALQARLFSAAPPLCVRKMLPWVGQQAGASSVAISKVGCDATLKNFVVIFAHAVVHEPQMQKVKWPALATWQSTWISKCTFNSTALCAMKRVGTVGHQIALPPLYV